MPFAAPRPTCNVLVEVPSSNPVNSLWSLFLSYTCIFSTTSADYFASQRNFFATSSADYYKAENNFFSTSSADYYADASTTIPKTYVNNVFSGTQTFANASTTNFSALYASSTRGFFGALSVGSLSGILKAVAGAVTTSLVSLATDISGILPVVNGGTGWASLAAGALPIGLAHRVKLKNDVTHGAVVRWSDVEVDANNDTIKTRKAMEAKFAATIGNK